MSYSSIITSDNPLLFYKLGENTGTSMVDSSGNGHNGTYTSPTWTGASIPGDAAANSLAAGRGAASGLSAPATGFAVAWFKTTDASGVDMCVLNAFGLKVGFKSGQLRVIANTAGTTWANANANPVTPNDGTWHYVLLSWTGTTYGLWIDDIQCNAASSTISGALTGTFAVMTIDGTTSNAVFTGAANYAVFSAAVTSRFAERYFGFGSLSYNVYACNDVVESLGSFNLLTTVGGVTGLIPALNSNGPPASSPTFNATLADGYPFTVEFNGTGISLYLNALDTSSVNYSLDGAANATIAPGGTGLQTLTIVSGLTAGRHVLRFIVTFNWQIARVVVVGGTGQLYSIARRQGFLVSNISGGDKQGVSPITSYGAWNRGAAAFANNGYDGSTLEFQYTGSGVDLLVNNDTTGTLFQVITDGGTANPTFMPAGYTGGSTNLQALPLVVPAAIGTHTVQWLNYANTSVSRNFTGVVINNGVLSTASAASGQKTITVGSIPANFVTGAWVRVGSIPTKEVNQIASIAGNVLTMLNNLANTYPTGTQVCGWSDPAGAVSAASLTPIGWGSLVGMGDSIAAGAGYLQGGVPVVVAGMPPPGLSSTYTTYDSRNSFLTRAAKLLGGYYISLAIQGTTTTQMATRGATDYALYAPGTAGVVVLLAGTNDVNTSVSVGTLTTQYQTIITQALAKVASPSNVICIQLFSPTTFNLTAYNAAIVSLAASNGCRTIDPVAGAGMNLSIYNASTNPTGDLLDALHPAPSGHQKLANALYAMLAPHANPTGTEKGGNAFQNLQGGVAA